MLFFFLHDEMSFLRARNSQTSCTKTQRHLTVQNPTVLRSESVPAGKERLISPAEPWWGQSAPTGRGWSRPEFLWSHRYSPRWSLRIQELYETSHKLSTCRKDSYPHRTVEGSKLCHADGSKSGISSERFPRRRRWGGAARCCCWSPVWAWKRRLSKSSTETCETLEREKPACLQVFDSGAELIDQQKGQVHHLSALLKAAKKREDRTFFKRMQAKPERFEVSNTWSNISLQQWSLKKMKLSLGASLNLF